MGYFNIQHGMTHCSTFVEQHLQHLLINKCWAVYHRLKRPGKNARNISTQYLAPLLHGQYCDMCWTGGHTNATFSTFSTQHVDVYVPQVHRRRRELDNFVKVFPILTIQSVRDIGAKKDFDNRKKSYKMIQYLRLERVLLLRVLSVVPLLGFVDLTSKVPSLVPSADHTDQCPVHRKAYYYCEHSQGTLGWRAETCNREMLHGAVEAVVLSLYPLLPREEWVHLERNI